MKSILKLTLITLSVIIINSCTSDYGEYGDYGDPYGGSTRDLSDDIINIVPDDILDTIEGLGMPINEGSNPPNIEGIFLEKPHTLKASNREDDEIGHVYNEWKFKMSNQNNSALTIDLIYKSGTTTGSSTVSYISGSGNNFSVFFEVLSTKGDYTAEMVRIISGTISESGIQNCHIALFMVDDKGDPNDEWIANGQGRILYDSDGLAEKQNEF